MVIILISSIFAFLFNKKIGLFIPLSIMIIVLTYYLVGLLFNSFYFVKYLLLFYVLVGIVFVVKQLNKNTYNIIFTNGLLLLFIIYVFVFIYCYKYKIAYFDEFYHWSPMVRSMFINNKLYSVCGIQGGAHIEYPPFLSLVELFYCQLYGTFSKSVSSMGMHIVTLSFFTVPYVDVFELKNKKTLIFFIYCILIIMLFGTVGYFRSMLIDIPLAFVASFPLILVFSNMLNNKYGNIYYGISLGCLLLTKQLGIIFYICNILLYFAIYYKKNTIKHLLKNLIIIIIVSMVIYIPWVVHIYLLGIGAKGQFSISSILTKILVFSLDQNQVNTLFRIGRAVIFGNMLKGKVYVPCIIFYILIISSYFIISRFNKIAIKKFIVFDVISIFLFFLSLSIIYCFSMEENEMLSLNNFFRYVASFNIYLVFMFTISIREYISNKSVVVLVLLLFIADIPSYKEIVPRVLIPGRINDESTDEEINVTNYIMSYLSENSNYLIVSDHNFAEYKFKYLTNYERKISNSKYFDEYSINITKYKAEDLINEMRQYDYVIFSIEYDDILYQLDNDLKTFTNCEGVYNCIVYEINKDYNEDSDILLYMLT